MAEPLPTEQVIAIATTAATFYRRSAFTTAISGVGIMWLMLASLSLPVALLGGIIGSVWLMGAIGCVMISRRARAAARAAKEQPNARWYLRDGRFVALDGDGVPEPAWTVQLTRAQRALPAMRALAAGDATKQ